MAINIFVTIIIILLALFAVYIMFFIRPRRRKPHSNAVLCDYAHRGLHGGGLPENSLAAFEKAVENGHGIELDVQLTKDGEVIVFHDYTMTRMTGCEKAVFELDLCEITSLLLAGTEERIPTFKQVLELVDGKVPLLVELKGESTDISLCGRVADILSEYSGEYCIESFNPLLLREMKKRLPNAFCGLLYTNVCKAKKKTSVLNVMLTLMAFNFLCKPNFIAYCQNDRHSFPVWVTTKLFRVPKFVWTVKGETELDSAHKNGEFAIFERR